MDLTEELVKHRSDLKHASVVRARVTPPTRHPMGMSSESVTLHEWDSLTFSFLMLTPAFICTISVIPNFFLHLYYTLYIPP